MLRSNSTQYMYITNQGHWWLFSSFLLFGGAGAISSGMWHEWILGRITAE